MSRADDLTGQEGALTNIALSVWRQGLTDGKTMSTPRTAEALMVMFAREFSWRVFHKKKIRQVYGAAFDISVAEKGLRAREKKG